MHLLIWLFALYTMTWSWIATITGWKNQSQFFLSIFCWKLGGKPKTFSPLFQFEVTNSKESWKGVKKLSKVVDNVWKTNNIFDYKLCWKNWICHPVYDYQRLLITSWSWSWTQMKWIPNFADSLQAFSEFLKHIKKSQSPVQRTFTMFSLVWSPVECVSVVEC
jgi:hypothetical protein